jgi:replicative DNA helicase
MTQGNGQLVDGPGSPVDPEDLACAKAALRLARGHRVSKRALRAAQKSPRWAELLRTIAESHESQRATWPLQWTSRHATRNQAEAALILTALAQAEEALAVEADDPDPDEPEKAPPFQLGVIGSAAFATMEFKRTWLIRQILVAGQPTIFGGPKKGLKTSLTVDLAVSLGSATRFLGTFEVPVPTKTLVLSGESGDATVQETAARVCRARGIDLAELEGFVYWGFTLPQLSNVEHLDVLARFIRGNGIACAIIDPLYLCLLSGNSRLDAANLFDTGPLLAKIAGVCLSAGATPVLVHHFRKSREHPCDPPELEDLAFAGIQEFARQWLMVGRREPYEPGTGSHRLWFSVGGSAGHSGAWALDVEEGLIGDDFQEREWNVTVAPASHSRRDTLAREQAAKAERAVEKKRQQDEERVKQIRDDAILAIMQLEKLGPSTKTRWQESLAWSPKRFSAALIWLEENGWVEMIQLEVRTGRGSRKTIGYQATGRANRLGEPNPDEPRRTPMNPDSEPPPRGSDLNPDEPRHGEGLSPEGGDPPRRGSDRSDGDHPGNDPSDPPEPSGRRGSKRRGSDPLAPEDPQ